MKIDDEDMPAKKGEDRTRIVDFEAEHVEEAARIAMANYEAERRHVPALPPSPLLLNLPRFAQNGLGVAAFCDGEDDRCVCGVGIHGGSMVGFMCSVPPFKNAFRSTPATGVFSPLGANGAVGRYRKEVYAELYRALGEKWVRAGATSHAVCLYAHDQDAKEQFFQYGFGLRCVDAIRDMSPIPPSPTDGYRLYELPADEILSVLPLQNMLDESYMDSPFFMFRAKDDESSFLRYHEGRRFVYLVAEHKGELVAYIRASSGGETFVCNTPAYMHIDAAYCMPSHRRRGLVRNLLSGLVEVLRERGITRLGVDFESMNPSAHGFWLRYFSAYTNGVVRRVDELGSVR